MNGLRSCCLLLSCLFSFPSLSLAQPWPTPSTFGGGFGVQIKGDFIDDANLTRIHDLGFGYVRFSIGWSDIEKARGQYDWTESDRLIGLARAHGLKMLVPLLGGHALYSGTVPAPVPNTDHVARRPKAPTQPEEIEAFARFAAQMALRYGSDAIVWELWNEPDLARFWPPKPDADMFSVLAEAACRAMKSVAPHSVVIGPALGRIPDARDHVTPAFMKTFLSSGAARCVDALSVHPYRHGAEAPEAVYGDYNTLIGLSAQHRFYGALVNSEWGYTTTQVKEEEQAAYVLRARLTDMIWGVPLSIWYEWKDSRDDPQDPEGHFGLIEITGRDKPAMDLIERVLPVVHDFTLQQQVATENPRDMVLLLKKQSGEKALIGWTLRGEQDGVANVRLTQDGEQRNVALTSWPVLLALGSDLGDIVVQSR